MVKITFLGTRGDIEEKERHHRHHTATLFSYNRKRLLIDWGESFRTRKLPAKTVILTRCHRDHFGGLVSRREADLTIWATRPFKESDYFRAEDFAFLPKFRLLPLRRSVIIDNVTVTAIPILHSIKAENVALLLNFPDSVKIFYATDVLSIRASDRRRYFKGVLAYIGDGSTLEKDLAKMDPEAKIPYGHKAILGQLAWLKDAIPIAFFTHFGTWAIKMDERALRARIKELGKRFGVRAIAVRDGQTFSIKAARSIDKKLILW